MRFRSFKRGTVSLCRSKGCKTTSCQSWRSEKNPAARPTSHYARAAQVRFPDDKIILQLWQLVTLQPVDLQRPTVPFWKDLNLFKKSFSIQRTVMIFNMATQSKRPTHLQDSINVYTRQLQWLLFLFFRIFFIHYWLHLTQISPLLHTLPGSPRAHRPLPRWVSPWRSIEAGFWLWLTLDSGPVRNCTYSIHTSIFVQQPLTIFTIWKTMDSLQLPPGLPSSADGALTGPVLCLIFTLLHNIFILIFC